MFYSLFKNNWDISCCVLYLAKLNFNIRCGERGAERDKVGVRDYKVQTTMYKIKRYKDVLCSTGSIANIL